MGLALDGRDSDCMFPTGLELGPDDNECLAFCGERKSNTGGIVMVGLTEKGFSIPDTAISMSIGVTLASSIGVSAFFGWHIDLPMSV